MRGRRAPASYLDGSLYSVAGISATDIAAGPGGQVWAIGKDSGIWQYSPVSPVGGSWSELGGGAAGVHLAVDALGPWVVNSLGQLWRYGPDYGNGNWTMIGDKGTVSAIGAS